MGTDLSEEFADAHKIIVCDTEADETRRGGRIYVRHGRYQVRENFTRYCGLGGWDIHPSCTSAAGDDTDQAYLGQQLGQAVYYEQNLGGQKKLFRERGNGIEGDELLLLRKPAAL